MKYNNSLRSLVILTMICLGFASCKNQNNKSEIQSETIKSESQTVEGLTLPSWAKSANIYEVNIRQYTPEGTFAAFTAHLPRLKDMEVDILWLMPIFPISSTKRKGTLGSYYAVSDFEEVNPEFGEMEDFENLVSEAHKNGMKVILDWVPNHTGWDHVWLKSNPEYYTQDSLGNPIDPIDPNTGKSWGWTDVADLNYDNAEMRAEMIDDMLFWINEKSVDGYRFDVAHGVPNDFWKSVRDSLVTANPEVFLLAEAELPEQMNEELFHMAYGWGFHHKMNEIAKGEADVDVIDKWLKEDNKTFTKGVKMHFTSNHDENSWAGTVFERMPKSHKTFAVLAATFDGMPLIYGGQEEPLRKRLEFFEKDDIGFKNYEFADFYTTLNKLKHDNEALWNEPFGGKLKSLMNTNDIYAYSREKNGSKVIVILNLSGKEKNIVSPAFVNDMTNVFTQEKQTIKVNEKMKLKPWEYLVFSKVK